MLFSCVKFLIVLGCILVLLCIARTWQVENSANQAAFQKGTLPNPAPDDIYKGSIGRDVSWLGKKFSAGGGSASGGNAFTGTGINIFRGPGGESERYPFVTSIGKGLRDSDKDVFKIDYDIPANPWWMHFILDEIVQIGPDYFLGKLQLRIIPGYPFTLAFFELTKE